MQSSKPERLSTLQAVGLPPISSVQTPQTLAEFRSLPPIQSGDSEPSMNWLRKIVAANRCHLTLLLEFLENGDALSVCPFPHELLARLPEDQLCIEPRFDKKTNTIMAGLAAAVRSNTLPPPHTRISHISATIGPAKSGRDSERFLERRYTSFEEQKKSRQLAPDLFIVDRTHPDIQTVINNQQRWNGVPVLTNYEARGDQLNRFVLIKLELEILIGNLTQVSIKKSDHETLPVPEKLKYFLQKLLETVPKNPLLVRALMTRLDETVLPLLRECGYPIAWAFPTSDEILVLPGLFYHSDVHELYRSTKGLSISPLASLIYFAADALHMRYFTSYDAEDVIKVPSLLNCVLPHVERLVETCEALREHGREPNLSALRMYVRGLMNGLVTLADFGTFEAFCAGLTKRSPRSKNVLDKQALKLYGSDAETFRADLQRLGAQFIKVMQRVKKFCPDEFDRVIPSWYEYFPGGVYGRDEVNDICRFNMKNMHLASWRRITFAEIVTGSTDSDVQSYQVLHRGIRPRFRDDRKRSQFSPEARRFVMHSREVWRCVTSVINGKEHNGSFRRSNHLCALLPTKDLRAATTQFFAAVKRYPEHALLFNYLTEFVSRLAPPADDSEALRKYLVEGERLYEALYLVLQSEPLREQKDMELVRPLFRAQQAFFQHLGRIAIQLGERPIQLNNPRPRSDRGRQY